MTNDRLSEVLDLIQVRSVVSGGMAMRGRWESRAAVVDELKFFAMVQGSARLSTNGMTAPIELAAGDVVVLNGRAWLELRGGTGDGEPVRIEPPEAGTMVGLDGVTAADDILLGGRVQLNPTGRELLLQTLPPVAHVGSASPVGPHLRGHVDRLFNEIRAQRVGSDFAVRQYGQLLLLDVFRGFLNDADVPPGWLKVLADERLRPALNLIHEQPAKAWNLEDLARAAGMSRTTFAGRFREVAGTTPMAYLIDWRMLLAKHELHSGDARIRPLALQLGYSSESAFSNAFKRKVGESPLNYRSRVRRSPDPATA